MACIFPRLVSTFMITLLAACGGGGDSVNGGDSQDSNTALVFTGENYESVSQAVLKSSDNLTTLSSSSSTFLTGVNLETPPALMPALVSQIKKIKSWSSRSTAALSGVEISDSEACTYGGAVNVSATDDNNNDELDAGDSMSISFENCATNSSERISGSMSLVVNSISDSYYIAADISMRLNNFRVVSGNSAVSARGDMRLTMQESSSDTYFSISSNSLKTSSTENGVTEDFSLSNFSLNLSDSNTSTDQLTYGGTLAMSSFSNHSLVVKPLSPWLIRDAAYNPYSGQMLLTSQAGSKIRITAVSSSYIRLELDASGDGVYEESKVIPWD